MIWNKIACAFIAVITVIISIITIFLYGKHKGKENAENKQNEEAIKTANEIRKDDAKRNNDDIDIVDSRLHKFIRK